MLVVLGVAVAVDTLAILTLLILTVRWHRASPSPWPRTRSTRTETLTLVATSTPAEVAKMEPDATSGPVTADPLADAISAFLGRSDGIFRAGGPPGQVTLPAAASPAAPGSRSLDAVPGPPAVLERAGSEVTWAPSRPTRYVPSGPRPGRAAGGPPERPVTSEPAAAGTSAVRSSAAWTHPPRVEPAAPPVATRVASAGPPAPPEPRGSPVSRLAVALVARDPTLDELPGSVARLGPVIGGLLRERTRADDRVAAEAPGRFTLILPATSSGGAEALADRLASSCDAWLAAESPALRLVFDVTEDDGPPLGPGAIRGRAAGPERRRLILQDA